MSEYNNFDFFPPFKDECLYSWIIRMLKFYSLTGQINESSSYDYYYLFGRKSGKPGLYFQKGIGYLLDKHDFGGNEKFSSVKSILERMTVFPFYLFFLEEERRISVYNNVVHECFYHDAACGIKLRQGNQHIEGEGFIKFCPKCFLERGENYLKIEHQIPGNFVCYKHKSVLKYLKYIPQWKHIDFFQHIHNASAYELNSEQYKIALSVSEMIHQIFEDGFLISLSELKFRIRARLQEKGYLNEKYNFYDYPLFLNDFKNDIYFTQVSKEHVMFDAIYDSRTVNPIYYLLLIVFLFGDLDTLYSYNSASSCIKVSKEFRSLAWQHARIHKDEVLDKLMNNYYFENYEILGERKEQFLIKHKVCGSVFSRRKRQYRWLECSCSKNSREYRCTNDLKKIEVKRKKYTFYVSAKEFGEMYGKKEKQIRNLCNAGRISGAIRVGVQWLIPEEAEYPKDKRYKNNKIAID